MSTFICTECNAPLQPWEFGRHVLMCIRIRVGVATPVGQRAANDQREAWERERNASKHGRVATPETPVPHGYGWGHATKPTPPNGKTECHWCSELDWKQCTHCDGKGYV